MVPDWPCYGLRFLHFFFAMSSIRRPAMVARFQRLLCFMVFVVSEGQADLAGVTAPASISTKLVIIFRNNPYA